MITYTQTDVTKHHNIPTGTYRVRVVGAEQKQSQSGNEMIVLRCVIILPDGREGPMVREYLVFAGSALWKVDVVRASLGWSVEPGKPITLDPEDFMGREGLVKISADQDGYLKISKWLVDNAQEDFPF